MFDAYHVAVRLSVVNEVTGVLTMLAGQFRAMQGHVDGVKNSVSELEKKLQGLRKTMLVGGAVAGMGAGALGLLSAPLEEALEFQKEVAKFRALGLGDVITQQAEKFAKGMNVIGSSARDNMKLMREAVTVLGDFEHAKEIVPELAKMRLVTNSLLGEGKHEAGEGMFMAALKDVELRGGLQSPEKMRELLNLITKAQIATGGLVDARSFLQMLKTGGVAAKQLDNESFFFVMSHAMQELGGQRAGTSLMSAYQNWALGRTTKQVAEEMAEQGLLDPKSLEYAKTGEFTKIGYGGMHNIELYKSNPYRYLMEVVVPKLKEKGFTTDQQILGEIPRVFSNRTAMSLFDLFYRERSSIDKITRQAQLAEGLDAGYQTTADTGLAKIVDLHKKWADVLNELGTAVLPLAIDLVEKLTTGVKAFTEFARDWPRLTKLLVDGFAVLGALFLVGGSATVIIGGFRALGTLLSATSLLATGLPALINGFTGLTAIVGGGLLPMLGKAGLIGAAAGTGIAAGYFGLDAADKASGGKVSEWLMKWFTNDKEVVQAGPATQEFIKRQTTPSGPPASSHGQTGDVYLDSHKVGKVLNKEAEKAANRPGSGAKGVDNSKLAPHTGSSGQW